MANFFPLSQTQRPGGTIQQTPPPPGLAFGLPNNMNGYGHHGSQSTLGGLAGLAGNNTTSPGAGSAQAPPPNLPAYQERLETFQRVDQQRNEFIRELITNYQDMSRKYNEALDDLHSEQQSRRNLQQEMRELKDSMELTKGVNSRLIDANPFAFVVIDGDGAIFNDELLSRGADGGTEAAHRLNRGIRNHLNATYTDAHVEDWRIMVQLVLNMEGLARKLFACKIIDDVEVLYQFGVGFSRSQHLFSFVDVGQGKERADHKVREMFTFMARMPQCKHLYFGPCHDNGYLPFLEPILRDRDMQARTTLFEATPAEPGYRMFSRVTFENVFRSENLPARPQMGFMANTVTSVAAIAIRRGSELAATNNSNSNISTNNTNNTNNTNMATAVDPSTASNSPPPPKNATPNPSSWAAMSKGAGTGKTIDIAPAKKPPRKYMLLNKDYERLDEQLPPQQSQYQKKFADRIKDKNCCNNFHLKGYCSNGDGCNFQHGERLSAGEQIVLRHKARSIKCNSGSWCEDFDCPYGHRCKFGGKDCGHDDCRFFDTHHVDSRANVKKYEDGTYEQV